MLPDNVLEALDRAHLCEPESVGVLAAFVHRLAAAQQGEPVAWYSREAGAFADNKTFLTSDVGKGFDWVPLYASAPPAPAAEAWRPISECPENESVVFTWAGNPHVGGCVIGRMERNRMRMSGHRRDLFWGGPWAEQTDEHPPTHWMPLPAPPAALSAAPGEERK